MYYYKEEIFVKKLKLEAPLLIAQAGPLNGRQWLIQEKLLIGRDDSCDIVINDRQVSRRHAQIFLEGNKVSLRDLDSKNGTYKNGVLINCPVYLNEGDKIGIALVQRFLFLSSDATVTLEKPLWAGKERTGKLIIDVKTRSVWVGEKEIDPPLSVLQFQLLQMLYEKQGEVVSRERIVQTIWKEAGWNGITEQAIDALVRRLRYRLKKIDPHQKYIVTVRGFGFRLENPNY